MGELQTQYGWNAFVKWLIRRSKEPSTWIGLAMIAVVLGSDPMQAQNVVQAISLIVGGGLVATGQVEKAAQTTHQAGDA